jgi:hypothetical protein
LLNLTYIYLKFKIVAALAKPNIYVKFKIVAKTMLYQML